MSGCYPPGVTGNEPQICGDGLEDKCTWCVENADEDATAANINDCVIEIDGIWACEECLGKMLAEIGINLGEVKALGKRELVKEIRDYLKETESELP